MREVRLPDSELPLATASFLACLATILELPVEDLPRPAADSGNDDFLGDFPELW